MVLKTRWAQPRTEIWRDWRKAVSKPPYPPTRESPVFNRFPKVSSNFSSHCVLKSRASQDKAGFYFLCLFTYDLSKYLWIYYCVPGTVLGAEDSAVTHRTLCSLLYPHHLEQCQAHTRYSINMCEVDENWNGQSTGGHHGPFIPWLGDVRMSTGSRDLGQDLIPLFWLHSRKGLIHARNSHRWE